MASPTSSSSRRARSSRSIRVGRPLVERVVAPTALALPVAKGQRLGRVEIYEGNRLVASSASSPPTAVPDASRLGEGEVARDANGAQSVGDGHVIVTVTTNAALDRTLTVPVFQIGFRHRSSEVLTLAGGKGINVARALKILEVPVVATGLAGGRTGTRIIEELTSEAILNDFVRIAAESRTSTAVVDPTAGTHTEINEWGPEVTRGRARDALGEAALPLARRRLRRAFGVAAAQGADDVLCGCRPRPRAPRRPASCSTARASRCVSASKPAPFLVSPNQREAEQLVGQELEDDDDFLMALDAIAEMGARNVLITLENGCFALLRVGRSRRAP